MYKLYFRVVSLIDVTPVLSRVRLLLINQLITRRHKSGFNSIISKPNANVKSSPTSNLDKSLKCTRHSLIHSLNHLPTHSLIHSLTHPPTNARGLPVIWLSFDAPITYLFGARIVTDDSIMSTEQYDPKSAGHRKVTRQLCRKKCMSREKDY